MIFKEICNMECRIANMERTLDLILNILMNDRKNEPDPDRNNHSFDMGMFPIDTVEQMNDLENKLTSEATRTALVCG